MNINFVGLSVLRTWYCYLIFRGWMCLMFAVLVGVDCFVVRNMGCDLFVSCILLRCYFGSVRIELLWMLVAGFVAFEC